jgi:GTPase SAR1 family protein
MVNESFKIIICGELAVGKSAIFERVQKGTFPEYTTATISAHFATK